ncbi:peroxidase family protein [Bradyrhizobium sp. SYSU BS000235]|uniref:peroxidase family protein n=1 Tax=Bradyrhizobium sp. SYSU BS000235 TaxID=3411332 RepID=UPI003C736FA4
MVSYIKSDLEFILKQIKIAEAHAAFTQGVSTGDPLNPAKPLFGPGGSVPAYNVSWGLRTVDGTYNNLLHPDWGSSDTEFPENLGTDFRPAEGGMLDPDGPGPAPAFPTQPNYNPSNDPNSVVVDGSVRTISNLIVDQTLSNPSAILTALQRAGIVPPDQQMAVTAQITAAFEPIEPLFEALTAAEVAAAAASAAAAANPGDADLAAAAAAAEAARAEAEAALTDARAALDALLEASGIELDGVNVSIPNAAPDEGLSASFNSWFTLFGQFFDHGLDLVAKGGSGTVFIPLQPDDPLYDPASPTNFMVLTRATVLQPGADGVMGTADDVERPINNTTAFVDQNQTYASHGSHQVFLREYAFNAAGDPVATGKLIQGGTQGMATWGDLKVQARDLLGIQLVDSDVGNVPLLATDEYGNFIPGANGFAQIVFPGASPGSFVLVEGDPTANGGLGVSVAGAVRTGHAFLADIAHDAVPDGLADGDIEIGLDNGDGSATDGNYDNELLDAHFVAGDGRANENIGLTAVHHVFHSEHNRLVDHTKEVVLATGDLAFLNEWLAVDVAALPTTAEQIAALVWDGERVFQAAKFGTEMQYQHLVFEEFARKIQPNINVFLVPDGFDVTIDPSIVAEFAHVVYRFGHSMLTESIDRFDPAFNENHIGLIEGFLNPLQFENNGTGAAVDADIAAGAIVRGMTRQVGNEIDEFVTGALRNNLLGLPLDLATINLARGRDTGVPSLNEARSQFYAATNQDVLLKPYESWVDFAGHLKHEASIINFIAAYGTHSLITGQDTIEGKRNAALTIITGVSVGGLEVPPDAVEFLNATGAYAGGSLGGLNDVDLWIGGLAEAIMPFGGMLGSTFNFVFETQMEKLQNGDRFYYLQRLDGLHLFGEMENNSFAAMIMRNTNATHLPSDVFSTPGLILEVDQTRQFNDLDGDGTLESADPVGSGILTPLVVRNNPATPGTDTNYLRYTGGDHVVLGGTEAADILIAGIGDDTLFGDGNNDRLEGGFGNDIINGGAGDDIIVDSGGDDNIKGENGNDVVHAGPGLDLVMGGAGQDFIFLGTDMGSEVFAGEGNDFIYGNKNAERILGNEGNDWIETGTFDGAPGDNFDEIFAQDGIDGHDVFLGDGGFDEFIAEGGDDIMVGSAGRGKMVGMSGWDWATYKDNDFGVDADFTRGIVFDENPNPPINGTLDAYEAVEGLSGSSHDDLLTGSDVLAEERLPFAQGGTEGYTGSALDAEGIALIAGLQDVLGAGVTSFSAGEIILGGDGSDIITGRAGDDIIDGDKWLDVQIGVFAAGDTAHIGPTSALHDSMTTLATAMFAGNINPGQLGIVRTIRTADGAGDTDVAVFSDDRANYDIIANANGTITVAHARGTATDGTDTLRNIEVLRFADGDLTLTPPVLSLDAFDSGEYLDQFTNQNYTNTQGVTPWAGSWAETSDPVANVATTGAIQVIGGTTDSLRFGENGGNGASIQRTVNLAGATTATLTFTSDANNLEAGEGITVFFSADGVTFNQLGGLIGGNGGVTNQTFDLTGPFTANAAVRFVTTAMNNANENVFVDDVRISFVRPVTPPNEDFATTFTEGGAAVAIASGPLVTDADSTQLVSARIVLTNAQLDDQLVVGALPATITSAIDLSVSGQIIVNLIGAASFADYQAAIQAVSFVNDSPSPTAGARTINVTVNDAIFDSNIATSTVTVVGVNNAPVAADDAVITNFAANAVFSIPEWALLANDVDPDGDALDITAVGGANSIGSLSLATNPGSVTLSDTGGANGSFTYTLSDGSLTDGTGNDVTITRDTSPATVDGTTGNNIIVGDGTNSAFNGLAGDDIIFAGGGTDTITQTGSTGGRDFVDGGAGVDTYQLNGAAGAETFVIYSRAAAIAAFAGLVLNDLTEIVITRNGSVIAELDNIEEIRVNTLLVTSPPGTGGSNSGDTIQVVGDFTGTSLNFNTITIDGDAGNDTIDISSLDSAHRIVFRSNGGNDTIVGTLRPQDVIELPDGATRDDYVQTVVNGVTTLSNGNHSVTYVADGEGPQIGPDDEGTPDEDDGSPPLPGSVRSGTAQSDTLVGTAGDDNIVAFAGDDVAIGDGGADAISLGDGADFANGGAGRDVIFAGAGDDQVIAGADADIVYGDAGADRILGDQGNDLLTAGAGDDTVFGGAGDDLIVSEVGDGNDVYFGDESDGGVGRDTLDISAATVGVTVNLGASALGKGSAVSSQTGNDTLWGIENVNTGSGNDTITASNAVNVIDGGAGNDVFKFTSTAAANGDTILGFEPGDRLDLSGIDANSGAAADQAFTLVTGAAFTAAGQLAVSYETRADGEYTVVTGNTGGSTEADFAISIEGHQNLTNSNFNL